MYNALVVATASVLGLAALAPPAAAQDTAIHTIQIAGQYASAALQYTEGCVLTQATVFAVEEAVQSPPGPGEPGSRAVVTVVRRDVCADAWELLAVGEAPAEAFRVRGDLRAATLRTTVPVTDAVSKTTFALAVDLAWAGDGRAVRRSSHSPHYRSPTCRLLNVHGTEAALRDAAASGSVSDGTANYFAPDPRTATVAFAEAEIGSFRRGELSITIGEPPAGEGCDV